MGKKLAFSVYDTDPETGEQRFLPAYSEVDEQTATRITTPGAFLADETAAAPPVSPLAVQTAVTANPDDPTATASPGQAVRDGAGGPDVQPPAGNASSETWRAYAETVGVQVPTDAGREDIKQLLSDRGLLDQ